MQRLDKLLAERSHYSRSQIRQLCRQKLVTINGELARDPAAKYDPQVTILVDGESYQALPGECVLVLHKPAGYVCANSDNDHLTVFSLLPSEYAGFHTVGRLDVDTTGLLLITNDGQFTHRMTSPKKGVSKVYRATLADPVEDHYQDELAAGIQLRGELDPCLPAKLEVLDDYEVLLTVDEGRYHQVKRMFAALGNKVEALHREAIGQLTLGELAEGEFYVLSVAEAEALVNGTAN